MRAPFNTTATVYDGPGTATPGFPRLVNVPVRLVSDIYFVDFSAPLNASDAYFTMEVDEPRASVNTDMGGGIWQFDFSKADRVEFAALPGMMWVVIRTELCTWPRSGAPYWRASIVVDDPPPSACSLTYADVYDGFWLFGTGPITFNRTGPTTWEDGVWTMQAETDAASDECVSTWRITSSEGGTWEATYDGLGAINFYRVGVPGDYIVISVAP